MAVVKMISGIAVASALVLAPLLSWATARAWRAFRWLVLAPGLWRRAEMPSELIVARAAILAVIVGSLVEVGSGSSWFSVAGMIVAGAVVHLAMATTLIQLMVQNAIHGY